MLYKILVAVFLAVPWSAAQTCASYNSPNIEVPWNPTGVQGHTSERTISIQTPLRLVPTPGLESDLALRRAAPMDRPQETTPDRRE
jgi:hypothetical protein